MASKYTSEQVIKERRCGLKYADKAIELTSREHIISERIKISKVAPEIWGGIWSNASWAIGNVIINIIDSSKSISQTWNLHEWLTEEKINFIAKELNISEPYEPLWKRKK